METRRGVVLETVSIVLRIDTGFLFGPTVFFTRFAPFLTGEGANRSVVVFETSSVIFRIFAARLSIICS